MTSKGGIAAPIAAFLENFYKVSDTKDVHQDYTEHFVNDPNRLKFQIGPMDPTNSRDGILAWRHKGWEGVTRRKHVVNAVFVNPERENDIMLDGTVEMDKNGSTVKFHWAGRMVFDKSSLEASKPLIETYKVWLVSTTV